MPFFNPNSKIRKVIISGEIKYINNMLFYGWENLTEVILENGVEGIGDFAFAYCINLKKIFVPDSVKYISNTAFYGDFQLENVISTNSNNIVKNKLYLNYIKLKMMLLNLTSKRYSNQANNNLINGDGIQKIEDFNNYSNIMIEKNNADNFIPWPIIDGSVNDNFISNTIMSDRNNERLLEIVRQNPEFEIDNEGRIFYCGDLMTPFQVEILLKNIEKNDIFKKR